MKNTPKILIVSITKLKIVFSIIVQNLVVNNVAYIVPRGRYFCIYRLNS